MKKLTALLLALALVLSMTACVREGPVETVATQPPSPIGDNTEDQVYIEPDPTDREPTVRLLNYDPETDAFWRALAKEYTEDTGIQVIAMTTASGVYDDVLPGQLGGSSPVTVFFVTGPEDIGVSCADLSGYAACGALTDASLALTAESQVIGLPFHTESYGLLVDTELLAKTGFTTEDLLTLEGLTRVVTSVSKQADELGFQAFAVPALGSIEMPRLLFAAAEGDTDPLRPVLDLAFNNWGGDPADLTDRTGADGFDAFLKGQALLCLASSDDMAVSDKVTLLPIPTAEGGIIGLGSEGYLCVNADALPGDIEASIAFLDWVLTEKTAVFEGRCLPYGEGSPDPLTRQVLTLDARRTPMVSPEADRLPMMTETLAIYAMDPTEENWTLVRDAYRK